MQTLARLIRAPQAGVGDGGAAAQHMGRACARRKAGALRLLALLALGAHAAAAAAAPPADLEALAWAFRFTHSEAHSSPLVPPLQRTLVRMQQRAASGPAEKGLCVDECGEVERLTFWGSPDPKEEDPEMWVTPRNATGLYSGKFCRLRRTLQPLYDACLHVRKGGSGAAYWHDHLGTYWRGMNTSECVRRPAPGKPSEEVVCRQDSGHFSANDEAWLRIARPFVAEELRAAPEGELLAAQAVRGAPSLDRLLLLARLACLSDSPRDAGSDADGGDARAGLSGLQVLVVGGGPVGLMTAVHARLTGAAVTVWEKREVAHRTRDNVVDASESDRSTPEHPGSLTLLENIGLLHLGISGMWVRPRFLRATKTRVAQYTHTPGFVPGEENEWELLHSLKELEYALQKVSLLLGARLEQAQLVSWHVDHSGPTPRYTAQGRSGGRGAPGGGGGAGDMQLPVDVLVGADGENSRVRGLANITAMMPQARIRMTRKCASEAKDILRSFLFPSLSLSLSLSLNFGFQGVVWLFFVVFWFREPVQGLGFRV